MSAFGEAITNSNLSLGNSFANLINSSSPFTLSEYILPQNPNLIFPLLLYVGFFVILSLTPSGVYQECVSPLKLL